MGSSPPFTHAEMLAALHYEPETGDFSWRVSRGKGAFRKTAGTKAGGPDKDGYTRIKFKMCNLRAARMAWFYVHGIWPPHQVDHENGIRNDDRLANLRLATPSQNTTNQAKKQGTSSRYKGVCWNKSSGKWQAIIKHHGRAQYLGLFDLEEDAAAAYAAKAVELHGDFGRAG